GAVAEEIYPRDVASPLPQEVDREFRWRRTEYRDGAFEEHELDRAGAGPRATPIPLVDLDLAIAAAVRAELAQYLRVVNARDATYGHAAWLVDRLGYRVEPAAAYARVLADTAAGLVLRQALARDARRAIGAEDMHRLSQPTIGAIL
ncbi:MAG: hypothetical protein ACYDCK_11980, partial [Thermoplasmatota archaeon]